jgi:PAS domain S-box-containing protein
VLAALLLSFLPPAESLPFLFFFGAVTLSARVCGFGSALFATVLSAAAADFFLMKPRFAFAHTTSDLLRLLFFGLVAVLITSIAKQKSEAEKVAEEKRGQLAALVESSDDAIFNKALDGTILTWNRGAQVLYGYRPDEIVGKNVTVLAPPEKSTEIAGILDRLRRGERVAHFETERVTKDGREIDVSLSISPVLNEEGRIVEAATIARDITERKRAETALRLSEKRLRVAHTMANSGAFDWNVETGDVTWFAELPALRDLAPDGKFETWAKVVHPDDKAKVDSGIENLLRGESVELEVRVLRPDGQIVWLHERADLYSDEHGARHCLGVAMDVTQRKQAEQVLRQTEKLAAAGQLAATIAHELNNPLEAVTNLVYLACKSKSLDEKTKKQLELVDQELARMAHLTRRTLGFYRDTSNPVSVDVGPLMDEVLTLYTQKLRSKRIDLQKQYATHANVTAFPGEMRKVFSNLIANAIDAVQPQGRIVIRVRDSHERRNARMPGVRVTVADSGSGIKPLDKARIFDPLYTTKKDTGTGLGLWLSKDIVQKHGGSISVRSRRGCTVFWVFIPANSVPISVSIEEAKQTA